MSRPIKQGLDYFPLDVDIDDKIELIEAKHGIVGFGIVIKLFQRIYKEGYFLYWNEQSVLLFSKRINVDINKVNDVINDCLCYQLLDKCLHKKYGILTSSGIQKRYLTAIDRRKEINLCKNYINVDINGINVHINWINDDNNTQSKEDNSKEDNSINVEFSVFWDSYHSITGLSKSDKESSEKYWKKLKEEERQKAINNIKPYFDSLNDKKYCKKARTYLSAKNFNDEFKNSIKAEIPITDPRRIDDSNEWRRVVNE